MSEEKLEQNEHDSLKDEEGARIGTIYIVWETDGRYYKIGFTEKGTPEDRVKLLQYGNPRKLRVVSLFPDQTQAIEREIHLRLVNFRAEGEWFEQNSALDSLISKQMGLDEFLSLAPHELKESKQSRTVKMLVKQLYTAV